MRISDWSSDVCFSDLLAPMGVVETLGIELQHPCDEGAIGLVRTCGNVGEHGADRCRHIVGPQCHARDDAEGSTAAAPEREEKLGSLDGVDDPYRTIRR